MIETIAILLAALALAGLARLYADIRVLQVRLDQSHTDIRALQEQVRAPRARAREEEFIDEEEAWPKEIRDALAMYPPELAEPTRQWIRQQRRFRVGWDVIKRRVLSNEENAFQNNWEVED